MCLENCPRRSEKVYYHGDNGSLGCVDWIHAWSEAGIFLLSGGSRLLCWEPRSKLEIPDWTTSSISLLIPQHRMDKNPYKLAYKIVPRTMGVT